MNAQWSWALLASVMNFEPDEIIEVCRYCQVNALEYGEQGIYRMRENEISSLNAYYREAGIFVQSFHLPFSQGDDIASFYETVRQTAVDKMIHYIEKAALLGAHVVVQHPTTNRDRADINGLETYVEQLKKSLNAMLPVARQHGIVIGLENMTPGSEGGRFCSLASHFSLLNEQINDEALGFVYDTGHALLSEGPRALEILRSMGDRVVGWHLSDTAGDRDSHLPPGRGEVDWNGVFEYARSIQFSAPMTMETAPWGPAPYSLETWKKTIDALNALSSKANTTK